MSLPTVSVVLPVYNGEAFLREAVDSILSQTFRDLELLLIDDFSTDGSRRIAEDYAQRDARVRVITNTHDKGLAGAENTGLEAATGTYIARMDHDDISLPERLERQVAFLEAHPEVTLCGTWVRLIGKHAGVEWKLPTDWDTIRCTMLFCGALAHPTVMWRRADFERHHWRYDAAYKSDDYELWTRIAEQAWLVNLPEILFLYRTHEKSYTQEQYQGQRQSDRQIHLQQLQRMELVPTADELDLHERLSLAQLQPTREFARQAIAWLDKLLAANERSGFFPETAFEQVLARKKQEVRKVLPWLAALPLGRAMLLGKTKDAIKHRVSEERIERIMGASQAWFERLRHAPQALLTRRNTVTPPAASVPTPPPAAIKKPASQPPVVTVLLPMFNAATYLGAAIESILTQSFTDFELLIIDDSSTDNSLQIAESYRQRDPRIRLLTNARNLGVAEARNLGMEQAQGKYLAFMDADDISLPERLAAQVAHLDAHPEVSVCGAWVRLIGEHAGTEWHLATDWDTIRCTMLFCGALANPTVMLRRADFLRNHWRCAGRVAEDYDLWTRIAETAQLVNLPKVLLLYRQHASNTTKNQKQKLRYADRRIHQRQLERMGLTPSTAELAIHEVISQGRQGLKLDAALRANAWLDKLLTANRSARFLPEAAFDRFILKKRLDVRAAMTWRAARSLGWMTVLGKAKDVVKPFVPQAALAQFNRQFLRWWPVCQRLNTRTRSLGENIRTLAGCGCRLQKTVPPKFKIGMAILAHERPDYLELCLDSLFKTNLHDYDITFLISDDGSQDPRVREIIERPRDPRYNIVRAFTPKGPNNAGAAINKAVRRLLELGDFDIIGWCDPDALFHPDWLDQTMKICLWAKRHHKLHALGPFSSFNSSDYVYHRVLGTYHSPFGDYMVKRQMGMLNYFYLKEDFQKLGFFAENPDEETLMTERFDKLGVRNLCTATSYVEHLGQESVLNQWRPIPVRRLPHGRQLATEGWGYDLERLSPYAFYRYLKKSVTFGADLTPSAWPVDVLIPIIRKDLATLPLAIASLRRNLRHPLGKIILVSPQDEAIEHFCREQNCEWRDENSVLPIKKADIHYSVNGVDRAGWLFQQFLKLSADQVSDQPHILLMDADTLFLQPQKFEQVGHSVLLVSDEYHWPYYVTFQKLLGYPPPQRFSFIAHHMLIDRRRLAELRAELERRHQRPWHQAILDQLDHHEGSSFSEFETYGHWMLQNHRDELELEYWHNLSRPRRTLWRHAWDLRHIGTQYRSLSYQHYHV